MNPYNSYQAAQSERWTRIEMLLALYARGIEHIQSAIDASVSGDETVSVVQRAKSAAVVATIRSGIEVKEGEVTENIDRLCEFVQACLARADVEHLKAGLRVLEQIAEGFQGIRDEAIRLERAGEIPTLPEIVTLDATI